VDGTFGRGGHAAGNSGALRALRAVAGAGSRPGGARCAASVSAAIPGLPLCGRRSAGWLKCWPSRDWIWSGDGMLLDLGVSSPQLDDPERGFSFTRNGPLDMRMDPTSGSERRRLAGADREAELARVLAEFGEERFYRRVARAIVVARQQAPIETTARLAEIIAAAVPLVNRASIQRPALSGDSHRG
jgi:16S rRNA (cytosine1402-N4)-methyltransferase